MNSKLNQRRRDLKLSTTELSHLLGVSQSTVVRLEQSESSESITLASLKKAAKALGCTLTYSLTPDDTTKRFKSYCGLKRSRTSSLKRTESTLGQKLVRQVNLRSSKLSQAEKILQSCSLSDLSKELRCSRKR